MSPGMTIVDTSFSSFLFYQKIVPFIAPLFGNVFCPSFGVYLQLYPYHKTSKAGYFYPDYCNYSATIATAASSSIASKSRVPINHFSRNSFCCSEVALGTTLPIGLLFAIISFPYRKVGLLTLDMTVQRAIPTFIGKVQSFFLLEAN